MDAARILIAESVAKTLAYWLVYWRTHCWNCEGDRDYECEPVCCHCGADSTPF